MLRIEYFDKERFMRQLSASHGSVLLHLDNGKTCDLRKLMALMGMGVKQGDEVTVQVEGPDEDAAFEALEKFFQENL